MGALFTFGVVIRILLGYSAVDLSFEGSFLAGLIAGPLVGLGVGFMVSIPALGIGELAALPVSVLYGLFGGLLNGIHFHHRARIFFNPVTLLLGRGFKKDSVRKTDIKRDILLLLIIVALAFVTLFLGRRIGSEYLFTVQPMHLGTLIGFLLGTALVVAMPIMIWDHTYMEMTLMERERGLTQARLDALKNRIQPHFLFNTLNTIVATIRIDPNRARSVVLKLSQILRTILDTTEDFRPFEQEMLIIDHFLDIERARFGDDRIQVKKQIDPSLLQVPVPTLLLQPIVENSVAHGLRRKHEQDTISIEARRANGRLEVVVEDNGIGIDPERLKVVKQVGIGLSNVEERLRVLYGTDFDFEIESEPGRGTKTRISFPLLHKELPFNPRDERKDLSHARLDR